MIEFLNDIEFWHWFILCFVLLGFETLGIGGFTIGIAIAALLQGTTVYFMPEMPWQMQTAVFGFDAIIFSFVFWKFFPKGNDKEDHPSLNDRASILIGKIVTLENDVENGAGSIYIGDTRWKVKADSTLKKGTTVEVTGTDGMVLMLANKESE